ncbi:MAG: DeoR/GlpR family DNA-binding transcription regulator [Chitinophagaceae bacterium]
MLKSERQAYILHQLNLHNKVLSSDLCVEINVSEDTVRRDLNELDEAGKIIKVHGGAISKSFHKSFSNGYVYGVDKKRLIAQKVIPFIKDGMFILTSGGTTVIELAHMLPENLKATFLTVSLAAALEYSNHPNIDVIFIGDKISKESQIAVGAEAIIKIKNIRADLCIMGINALDINMGLTDNDWDIVQIKKAMIEVSEKTMLLSISEKLNTQQKIKICDASKIDYLITELEPTDEQLENFKQQGITIY